MPASPKIIRWIDLLGALLSRRKHVTLDELKRDVPGYTDGDDEAIRQRFERDKKELRRAGIDIETIYEGQEAIGYRLDPKKFYLPFLQLVEDGSPRSRLAPLFRPDGYRGLTTIQFEPDEMSAVLEAWSRVEQLGIPALAEDAKSGLRKLGHDLPLDDAEPGVVVAHGAPASRKAERAVWTTVRKALRERKLLRVEYFSIQRNINQTRVLHPLGLFYLGHHWYLAARGLGKPIVKNFRLSRMSEVVLENPKSKAADFPPDPGFSLKAHAESRLAWELGDNEAILCDLRLVGPAGAVQDAARLGEPVDGDPARRRFRVRRMEPFMRWVLGFGGVVTPEAPPELVTLWRDAAAATLALYPEAR